MHHVTRRHVTSVSLSYARGAVPSVLSASATGARDARRLWGLCLCSLCQSPLPPVRRNATYYPSARPRLSRDTLVVTRWRRSPLVLGIAPPRSSPSICRTRGLRGDRTPAKCQLGAHSSLSLFLSVLVFCRVSRKPGAPEPFREVSVDSHNQIEAPFLVRVPDVVNPETTRPRVALSETAATIAAVSASSPLLDSDIVPAVFVWGQRVNRTRVQRYTRLMNTPWSECATFRK